MDEVHTDHFKNNEFTDDEKALIEEFKKDAEIYVNTPFERQSNQKRERLSSIVEHFMHIVFPEKYSKDDRTHIELLP